MMEKKALTLLSSVLVALAACASAGEDDGSTTTTTDATTTTVPKATSTTAPPESTTSTAAEPTTTTTAPESSGDLSLVHAAIAKTVEAVPPRAEGTVTIGGIDDEFVTSEIEMKFFMTTDPATGDSEMVMVVEDAAEMAGDAFDDVPAELTDMIGEMETRKIGGTMYMRSLNLIAMFGAETVWVSMPAAAGDRLAAGMGPDAAPDSNTGLLESFSDAKGKVETLGEGDVRGIVTTRYQLLLDDDWIESRPENLGVGTAEPLEVWIDKDGLVRRLFFQAGPSESADIPFQVESVSWDYEFFDFGESVTIEPPPADQVTDIEDLMGGFSGFDS